MALTLQEVQGLRVQGKYRETIAAVEEWEREHPSGLGAPKELGPFRLEKAWAYYQLGEYDQAERWGEIVDSFINTRDTQESVSLLLAHCAERYGDLNRAEVIVESLSASVARDNLYLTILIGKSRKGLSVSSRTVIELVVAAQMRTPYQVVDAHIINNGTWFLYGVRNQEDVKPFLPILPGLIEVAIGIYEATKAANNHRAAALFRASNIFLDVVDWPRAAMLVIEESITFWEQLVASEGGERYQKNLEGARTQREKILTRLQFG